MGIGVFFVFFFYGTGSFLVAFFIWRKIRSRCRLAVPLFLADLLHHPFTFTITLSFFCLLSCNHFLLFQPYSSNLKISFKPYGTQSTPKSPLVPSQTMTGGLPFGLVKSMPSNLMFSHTAFGEQTSFATLSPLVPELLPVKFWNRMSVMSTREG